MPIDPVLKPLNFKHPFILQSGASGTELGVVWTQEIIGIEYPVAYASRQLNSAEIKRIAFEKEALALKQGTNYSPPYLYGRHFTVQTDHNLLRQLNSAEIEYTTIEQKL